MYPDKRVIHCNRFVIFYQKSVCLILMNFLRIIQKFCLDISKIRFNRKFAIFVFVMFEFSCIQTHHIPGTCKPFVVITLSIIDMCVLKLSYVMCACFESVSCFIGFFSYQLFLNKYSHVYVQQIRIQSVLIVS